MLTLESLTSDLLEPVRHGFFTRAGGAASGSYAGLNCGLGSTDQREAVEINRARVAAAMGGGPLVTAHQVHSAKAEIVTEVPDVAPEADALVTATPGLVLGVLTADCQPVLFADPSAQVVAVAHAGWKGAMDGVLEATLSAMESLGAHRGNTLAVIGPSICQRDYVVVQ